MTDEPEEPEELIGIRNVSVFVKDTEDADWDIEIEYPEWMTPYEAYGMIYAAGEKLKAVIEDLNDEEGADE